MGYAVLTETRGMRNNVARNDSRKKINSEACHKWGKITLKLNYRMVLTDSIKGPLKRLFKLGDDHFGFVRENSLGN
jgi:hypothetical protein